jgi:hypothetical protein
LHFDGDQSTSRLIVRMPDADTLEMMEDGENGMRLVRRAQGAP